MRGNQEITNLVETVTVQKLTRKRSGICFYLYILRLIVKRQDFQIERHRPNLLRPIKPQNVWTSLVFVFKYFGIG